MSGRTLDKQKSQPMVLNVQSVGNLWDTFVEQTQPKERYEGCIHDMKTVFAAGIIMVVGETLKLGILHLKPEHKDYIFQAWRNECSAFLRQVQANNELAKDLKGKLQ